MNGSLPSPKDPFGYFEDKIWTLPVGSTLFRNFTLVGRGAREGNVLATHTVIVPSDRVDAYRLSLSLDVPSVLTGTGNALVLDGRDTAMIRASVVDTSHPSHPLVSDATNRITFRVVAGPGTPAGVSNGDPASHEWMKSTSVNAFMGLARGYVRVTEDCVSVNRDIARFVDVDANRSGVIVSGDCRAFENEASGGAAIVVEATAEGLSGVPARLSISVSGNTRDSASSVASEVRENHGLRYLETFEG